MGDLPEEQLWRAFFSTRAKICHYGLPYPSLQELLSWPARQALYKHPLKQRGPTPKQSPSERQRDADRQQSQQQEQGARDFRLSLVCESIVVKQGLLGGIWKRQ